MQTENKEYCEVEENLCSDCQDKNCICDAVDVFFKYVKEGTNE